MDLNGLIESIHASRKRFLNHLKGLRDDQWDWKPYPECKSIRETLAHLVMDDRVFLARLQTNGDLDYSSVKENETDIPKLLALMEESHLGLCRFIGDRFADTPLDAPVMFFTGETTLGRALAEIPSEDYYHAGQVAFIRLATDPQWNYYKQIYGWGE